MSGTKSLRIELAGKLATLAGLRGLALTTAGVEYYGDGYLHKNLLEGRGSVKTVDKVAKTIDSHIENARKGEPHAIKNDSSDTA